MKKFKDLEVGEEFCWPHDQPWQKKDDRTAEIRNGDTRQFDADTIIWPLHMRQNVWLTCGFDTLLDMVFDSIETIEQFLTEWNPRQISTIKCLFKDSNHAVYKLSGMHPDYDAPRVKGKETPMIPLVFTLTFIRRELVVG